MKVRVFKEHGMWIDVQGVHTWEVNEGVLVFHSFDPAKAGDVRTGIEVLAVFAAGAWSHFHNRGDE